MKIKFDASQQYQLDAIQSVVDLFSGQPMAGQEFEINSTFGALNMQHSVLGFGNRLVLSDAKLLENLHAVQGKSELEPSEKLLGDNVEYEAQKREYRLTHEDKENSWHVPHFSVEMETGTGKTYVYLRSIFELHKNYGFTKFIIVVPTVAIREGVKTSIDLTAEHFKTLYDNTPINSWVYDSKYASRLRDYAASNQIQILIINIDAFNKKDIAVIHNERDQTSGRKPIEFIQACNPVVILDEPQNMESEIAREAIASLNPLCTLRYSATHRNPYNVIYRLGPVKAYDLGLVKRIEVDSVLEDPNFNKPFIQVQSVQNASKSKIVAKLTVDIEGKSGPQRKTIKVEKRGDDLHHLTKRDGYKGYIVEEIRTDYKTVSFSNGITLEEGQTHGGQTDDRMRVQIKETVKEHFEKELHISKLPEGQRIKVLSLFFIDRVSNYRLDDGGKGKIALWFEEAYEELRKHERYKGLNMPAVGSVHDGYFAKDKKGNYKDSRESTENQEDRDVYAIIMQDKTRLLSFGEPLKFIFSHSALREGWDNPNVFQICTLNETRSEMKKRQEIGRGLRLPVRENGERCFDHAINRLTVVANESYEDFARNLQNEIEEETGEKFEGRVKNKRDRQRVQLKKGWRLDPNFIEIWNRIKHKTRYAVRYSTDDLVKQSAKELAKGAAIQAPKFTVRKSEVVTTKAGLETELRSARDEFIEHSHDRLPDLIGYLQSKTELTRGTLARIIIESGRIGEIDKNPQEFLEQTLEAIQRTLRKLMVDGIKYEKIDGDEYEMMLFEEHYEHKEIYSYLDRLLEVDHSIVNYLEYDSETEKKFAETLDKRPDIKLFFKMPGWFFVRTPLGNYNPDWAIVKEEQNKRGKGCKVLPFDMENENKVYFLVRHGMPFKREGKIEDGETGSVFYRPEFHDVVIYDIEANELQVFNKSGGKKERAMYLSAFGQVFFKDAEYFPNEDKYTLQPLLDDGVDSLSCQDINGLAEVRLTEVQLLFRGPFNDRTILRSKDIFKSLESRKRDFPDYGTLVAASFQVKFDSSSKPRTIKIKTPNIASFDRKEDAHVIEQWMKARGFIKRQETVTDEDDYDAAVEYAPEAAVA